MSQAKTYIVVLDLAYCVGLVFSYLLAITKIVGNFNICLRAKEVQHKGYVLDHTQEKYNNVSLVHCHSPGLKA